MAVKLRLMRFGCKHRPFYRVVVADSKSRRDGTHLEVLGYYNPLAGPDDIRKMSLKFDRVEYWLSVGAQPSDTVEQLLFRAGLATGRKGGQKNTHVVDPITGRVMTSDSSKIIHPEFANEDAETEKSVSA